MCPSPPCVLPQANLPLLQRELLHCARLAKQTPAQYLAQHEQLLLDANASSPIDSSELLLEVNENGKRRTPDRYSGLSAAGEGDSEGTSWLWCHSSPGTLVPGLRELGSMLSPAAGEQAGQVHPYLQGHCTAHSERLPCQAAGRSPEDSDVPLRGRG